MLMFNGDLSSFGAYIPRIHSGDVSTALLERTKTFIFSLDVWSKILYNIGIYGLGYATFS